MANLTELKHTIQKHLYSDLTDLLTEFLEPCLDYSVPKCPHEKAYCHCGHNFEFHDSPPINFFPDDERSSVSSKKYLWEKFCPLCSRPNQHKTETPPPLFPGPLRRSTHLTCKSCYNTAEDYGHQFCSACQAPFY